MKPIASSSFWIGKKGHKRRQTGLEIYRPERNPKGSGEYRCRVCVPGDDTPRNIFGSDSTQALMLAISFVMLRLNSQMEAGWRFYLSKTDRKAFDPKSIWMLQPTVND